MSVIRPLQLGKQFTLPIQSVQGSGTTDVPIQLDCDGILCSMQVGSVSGTLSVSIWTHHAESGQSVQVQSFPPLTAPTSNLLLRKPAAVMNNCFIRIQHTGAATFEIRVKGISAGETSTRILGANEARAFKATVGLTPAILIPTSLTDRIGLAIKNWQSGAIIYVGFSAAEATSTDGWPVAYQEGFAVDLAAGQAVWASSTVAGSDVRIVEAGS